METNAAQFKRRLISSTGLSESAINAAWPGWWSDEADTSLAAQSELRFTLARKLGLDPRSLLADESPRFVWDDSAKYKNYHGDLQSERAAITSFGVTLGRMLVRGCDPAVEIHDMNPLSLRKILLEKSNADFVDLKVLLTLLWSLGIPVAHLRIYPLSAKHMCAMSVRSGERFAILLAKDGNYPAATTFHLAHEIGHIALGHLAGADAVVDMDDPMEADVSDKEETEADRYALALLTGSEDFSVINAGNGSSAKQLAEQANAASRTHHIEPGVIALCYGHASKDWAVASGALKHIYASPHPVWESINKAAARQLSWSSYDEETAAYVNAVIGGI